MGEGEGEEEGEEEGDGKGRGGGRWERGLGEKEGEGEGDGRVDGARGVREGQLMRLGSRDSDLLTQINSLGLLTQGK